jgi:hypothetical protein
MPNEGFDVASAERLKSVRSWQSHRELTVLSGAIRGWLGEQRAKDKDEQGRYVGRHKTQLEALESVLPDAVEALHGHLNELDPAGAVWRVYDECRDIDEATVSIERLWRFFREKLDQRDDPRAGPLLRAADEVVWSCYHEVFEYTGLATTRGHKATPLSYVEPQYSPAAIQSDSPLPANLRPSVDFEFLEQYLDDIKVPVLRLPPWCIGAPWWLVYAAHEVGHHVLHDLDLEDCFGGLVEEAATGRGARGADLAYWLNCAEEIFADLFSVLMMGPYAVLAIAEAEWGTPERMAERSAIYPPAQVRLAMMAYAADLLMSPDNGKTPGREGTEALQLFPLDRAAVAGDIAVAEAIVDLALDANSARPCVLRRLAYFDPSIYRARGKVSRWGEALRGEGVMERERRLETAREVVCGSLHEWARLRLRGELGHEDFEKESAQLAERTVETVISNAPEGSRSQFAPSAKQPESGRRLADALLKTIRRAQR